MNLPQRLVTKSSKLIGQNADEFMGIYTGFDAVQQLAYIYIRPANSKLEWEELYNAGVHSIDELNEMLAVINMDKVVLKTEKKATYPYNTGVVTS